jgi:PAS domain S-box-containing protein
MKDDKKISNLVQENRKLKEKILELEDFYSDNIKIEKLIKESEDKFRLYYDNAPLPYQSLDAKGCILEVNKTWYKLMGYARDEVIGKSFKKFLQPDYKKVFEENFPKFLKTGDVKDVEFKMVKKDSSHIIISLDGTIIHSEDGKFKQTLCILNDITEKKATEETLKITQDKYLNLTKNAPLAICRIDTDGNCEYLNNEFVRQSGFTIEEYNNLSEKDVKSLIYPDDSNRVFEEYDSWSKGGSKGVKNIIYRSYTKNKDLKWLNSFHFADFDKEGKKEAINQVYIDVTEQKNTEEALRQSEGKYKSIVENTDDLVMLTLQDGIISYLSPACEKVLGHNPKDLIGKQPWIIHPDDLERVKRIHQRALKGKKGSNYEYRIITKKNEIKWISHSWSPVYTDNKLQTLVSVIRDITEKKQVEDALKESEEKYRTLVDNIQNGVFIIQDAKLQFVNDSLAKMVGYKVKELIGMDFINLIAPEDREFTADRYRKRQAGEDVPNQYDFRILHKDGSTRIHVHMSVGLVEYKGKIASMGTLSNITERVKSEEALRNSEESYRELFDNATDAIYIQDKEGRFLDVNQGSVNMYGYTKEFFLGKTPEFLAAPGKNDLVQTAEYLQKAFEGKPQKFEFWGLDKDGRIFPKEVRLNKGKYFGQDVVIAYAQDITERKLSEEELRKERDFNKVMINASPAFFVAINEQGKTVMMNKAMLSALGYSENEVIGKDYLNTFVPKEDHVLLSKIFQTLTKSYEPTLNENHILTKDGQKLLVEWHGRQIFKPDGKLDYFFGVGIDITNRKQAEETLRRSEELFRQLFENLPVGIVVLDKKGLVRRVNDGFEKIFQYKSEETLGKKIDDVVVPEHLGEESFELSSIAYEGRTVQKESIRKRKDGSLVPVYLYGVPVIYNEKAISIYGIYVDITDRKRAVEALREREARLSAILENLPSLIMFVDKDYKILSYNNTLRLGYIQMYGIKIEIGLNLIDSISDEYQKTWKTRYDKAFNGKKFTIEDTININGEDHYFSTSFNPVTTASNETLGVLVISQDITEYYRLSLVARQTTNSILITDLERHIQWVNVGFTRLTGYTLKESIGKSPRELLQGSKTDEGSKKYMMEMLDNGEGFSTRVYNYKKDKTGFWNELRIDPMYDSSGKQIGFIGIQIDVTEKVNQSIALKKAKESAEEASRLKTAFLANMSHEIRTPLNGILGFAELLSNELKLTEHNEMYSYAESIHKSGRRLLNVINDILDISKIEANKMELSKNDCSLEEIINRELILFYPIAESKGLKLNFNTYPKDLLVLADANRLSEVISNLVDNAIKFTENGSITIDIGIDETQNRNYFSVKDTGIGIKKDYLPYLFESFSQADNDYSRKFEGTGLGLSISKRLIELMNGSIKIDSKIDVGTKITVFLPASKPKPKKEKKEKVLPKSTESKELRNLIGLKEIKPDILLIEDDFFSSKVLKLLLYKYANISSAINGDEALEIINNRYKQNENFDIILMDIRLPQPWNGFTLREEIRKRWNKYSKVPFIAQTAFAMKEDQDKIISAGFDGYISKPIDGNDLMNMIFEKLKKNIK